MQELIAMRGIPCSGKTTWAINWVLQPINVDEAPRSRVNKDDIRKSVFGIDFGVDERVINALQFEMIDALVHSGYSVVVDNTHTAPKYWEQLALVAKEYEIKFSIKQIDIPMQEAKRRNLERERKVPGFVIENMHAAMQKYQVPDKWRYV